jgi:hypothetical protein
MAKRKSMKEVGAVPEAPSTSGKSRISTEIDNAENGFIVRVSSDGVGKNAKYESKRFIASSHPAAMRIAAQGMRGMTGKKSGKKKSRGKKFSSKKV